MSMCVEITRKFLTKFEDCSGIFAFLSMIVPPEFQISRIFKISVFYSYQEDERTTRKMKKITFLVESPLVEWLFSIYTTPRIQNLETCYLNAICAHLHNFKFVS